MKAPIRITVALDGETEALLKKLAEETGMSYSALIRTTLKFFSENKDLAKHRKRVKLWLSMLLSGEHLILDIDHWVLFLKFVEASGSKESFYEECKGVARSHAEQLSKVVPIPEEYLKRLEACNFFKLSKDSENEFTLVLNSEASKRFVKELISETLGGMGYRVDIFEDMMKLRVKIK